jgi:glycosyltransferase involved in cell wall biosynthesis
MPKVLHVLRKFEPAEWGGIETHLVGLIPELDRLGWRSEVHAPQETRTDGTPLRDVGAIFRTFRAFYPYVGMGPEARARLVAAGGNLVSLDETARLVLDRQATLFHVHTLGRLGGIVRTAARLTARPYAVTLHGPVLANADGVQEDARRRTQGLLDLGAPFGALVGARRVVHDANLVFTLNSNEHDLWLGPRKGNHLERIAHGVDLRRATHDNRASARRRAGVGCNPFVVIVARLDRAKGQALALEAFARAAPKELHLVLAGAPVDKAYADELATQAKPLGDRVHLLGGVSPAVARALFAEAHLALVPSLAEPFGIVLLEAWAEGTPTLFSHVDGLQNIAQPTGATAGAIHGPTLDSWPRGLATALQDQEFLDRERLEGPSRVARHARSKIGDRGCERTRGSLGITCSKHRSAWEASPLPHGHGTNPTGTSSGHEGTAITGTGISEGVVKGRVNRRLRNNCRKKRRNRVSDLCRAVFFAPPAKLLYSCLLHGLETQSHRAIRLGFLTNRRGSNHDEPQVH